MSSYHTLGREIYQPNKKNVGVFIRNLSHPVPQLEWQGMASEAEKNNINLFCFTGSSLAFFNNTLEQVKTILDLLHSKQFDGLVLWLSLMDNLFGQEDKQIYVMEKFKDVPCVTGESRFSGFPSVVHSHYEGMKELIIHCITVHGYKRIAFIQGPKAHLGARERFRAYQDTLSAYNIKLDKRLISQNTEWFQGEYAVSQMFHPSQGGLIPGRDVDCIICAATNLTLDVISYLKKSGFSVPGDVAVTGYDDTIDAQIASPALTTVRTPLEEMGVHAVRILVDQFEGKHTESIKLPGKLIIRESCGCSLYPVIPVSVKAGNSPQEIPAEDLVTKIRKIIMNNEDLAIFRNIDRIIVLFIRQIKEEKPDKNDFIEVLDTYLHNPEYSGIIILEFQKIVKIIYESLLPLLKGDEQQRAAVLLEKALVFTGEKALWRSEKSVWNNRIQNNYLREFETALQTDLSLKRLFSVILNKLPVIGIESCFMVLFEGSEIPHEWARLIFAFNENGEIATGSLGIRFPGKSIVPMGLLPQSRQLKMIVEPIVFENKLTGYIMFEMPQPEGSMYESLGLQISSSLKSILPFEVNEQKALITKRLNKEYTHFVHIFSHPLMEPLRKILSFGERVKKKIEGIPDVSTSEIDDVLSSAYNMYGIVNNLIHSMNVLFEREKYVKVNCREVLEKVISRIGNKISETRTRIIINDLPSLTGNQAQIELLFYNLLMISLDSFIGLDEHIILFSSKIVTNEYYEIRCTLQNLPQIDIEELIDSNSSEYRWVIDENTGSGLIAAICNRLVRRYQGIINFRMIPGYGIVWNLIYPMHQKKPEIQQAFDNMPGK